MAFRIVFLEWIDTTKLGGPSILRPWLLPQFNVLEEDQYLFFVNIVVPKGLETRQYQETEQLFREAILRYSVRRIEEGLRSESFLIKPPNGFHEINIEIHELPFIEKLLNEKTCTYQLKEGRDLFCSAASEHDQSIVIGHRGLQAIARTSRPLCRACNLPDTDYLCSHLLHPQIAARRSATKNPSDTRCLAAALCDLGKPGAESDPSQCRPGGHPCWERIVGPEIETLQIPSSPLALPEAFDYLDAVWRNAFGANHGLLRLTTVSGLAQLAQPCITLDEFESRLSVLSAVFKAMTVPDALLLPEAQAFKKDQSFDRIMTCKRIKELDEADYQAYDRAVKVLRTVNKVRNVRQHPDKREFLRALTELGVPYPPSSWGEAWDRIRSKTIEALATIREKIRILS